MMGNSVLLFQDQLSIVGKWSYCSPYLSNDCCPIIFLFWPIKNLNRQIMSQVFVSRILIFLHMKMSRARRAKCEAFTIAPVVCVYKTGSQIVKTRTTKNIWLAIQNVQFSLLRSFSFLPPHAFS